MPMLDKEDLSKAYIKCYNNLGTPLNKLRATSEEFQVFSKKKGLPVKYVSTKNLFDLPLDDKLLDRNFYRRQKGFYLIPNDYEGKIISFVIRGLTHEYYDVHMMSNVKPMFGWYTFKNYKKGYPIIVTEGTKDCIILQQYYPYTLAMLTAGITKANANILSAMTNKIILAYDKDKVGIKTTRDELEKLKQQGTIVQQLKPRQKDFGEDYKSSSYIKDEIIKKLRIFKESKGLEGCLED